MADGEKEECSRLGGVLSSSFSVLKKPIEMSGQLGEKTGERLRPIENVILKPIDILQKSVRHMRAFVNREDVKDYYDFDQKLGEGAFGAVYRGRDKRSGEEVAIKVIEKRSSDEDMMEEEINILSKVHHPNCVSMVEIFDTPRKLYVVMELVTGGELFTRITKFEKTFSESDVARFIAEICEGLKYLHTLGVVHRDLKPENILMDSPQQDAHCKIADFGLSKLIRGKNKFLQSRCGTPMYAAPELLQGRPYDSKVDMWSVGCILYVLLTGCPPFWGTTINELIQRIVAGTYPVDIPQFEGVSGGAKVLLRKLLCTDPKSRFSADDVLNHFWIKRDRKKLEFRKLETLVCMNEYVEKQRELSELARIEGEASDIVIPKSEADMTKEEAEAYAFRYPPLSASQVERLSIKYSEWPDYKIEFEKGNVLGVPNPSFIKSQLSRSSPYLLRAYDSGYIRPFLIVVSLHPRQRLALASMLSISLSSPLWYGDSHREAWEIISHPMEGIRTKTKGDSSTWADTLSQVAVATLSHFWDRDDDSKQCKKLFSMEAYLKSDLKVAHYDRYNALLPDLEESFYISIVKKIWKMNSKQSGSSQILPPDIGQLDDFLNHPNAHIRDGAAQMKSDVTNPRIVCAILSWYAKEGYKNPVVEENKAFLKWAKKEKSLNMSSVFLGKGRLRQMLQVLYMLMVQRFLLAFSGLYVKDFWPSEDDLLKDKERKEKEKRKEFKK